MIYARVSTSDQSCARQVAELTAFTARARCNVVEVFKETASGTSAKRAARKRVLDLAQTRQLDDHFGQRAFSVGTVHAGPA